MHPSSLEASQFKGYPPEARQFAISNLSLLRRLPEAFAPSLLREVILLDWKFPAERQDLEDNFLYLSKLSPQEFDEVMDPFSKLTLTSQLEQFDWVVHPAQYVELLAAELWQTHQIDAFRAAADNFESSVRASVGQKPPPIPRLAIVVLGQGMADTSYPLFRKLRPHGVYFSNVSPEHGTDAVLETVKARARLQPVAYGHWYIDGGNSLLASNSAEGLTSISYGELEQARRILLNKIQSAIHSGSTGPEELRTFLGQIDPKELGLGGTAHDAVLSRFQVSVLTEGSGTQIFSTTFSQWAAREALRRAQPLTMLVRFRPRQRERNMDELLADTSTAPELDLLGSLIDADMAAYYVWICLQRLSGAERSSFLVWFEEHREAVAIGPFMPAGTNSPSPVNVSQLLDSMI